MERSYPMKSTRQFTPAFVYLMFFLLAVPFSADSASGQPVEKLLPTPGFAEGWAIKEKIDIYTEKDLYKYINGEAELYYPYGFRPFATLLSSVQE